MPSAKQSVDVTKSEFLAKAKPLVVTINGRSYTVRPKEFGTKSVGFNINDKMELELEDGRVIKFQVGMNLTAHGSKEWPE